MTSRSGFALAELIVALALFSALLATTLGFYQQQGRAFTEGNERMTLMQNLRYGVTSLEQTLRTAGIGVPAKQPVVVYAGEDVVAINADYASNTANDFFAVYYDRQLPADAASALSPSRKFTLPGTAFMYPDSAYFSGSTNSPAETITFFFQGDATTERTDDYVLYRQVNDLAPDIVARHLLRIGTQSFFRYYQLAEGGTGSPVKEIPGHRLPAAHAEAIHGSPADTGAVALVDSVRAVEVAYAATNGLDGDRESRREIRRLIRLPNAGVELQRNCGNKPLLGIPLNAVGVKPTETTPGHVELSWTRATDEYTGEQDVIRYVIWRRRPNEIYGDPLASVSPGLTSYVYRDFTALKATKYRYALAAQDCTPQYSVMSTTDDKEWKE